MCDCEEGDEPEVFRVMRRRARRPHRCCECGDGISIGERYEYSSGVWDGHGGSFSTCLDCVVLRKAHVQAETALQTAEFEAKRIQWVEPCNPVIGSIRETIGECCRDDREYVKHFRVARRELLRLELSR